MAEPATAIVSLLKQSGTDIESQICGTSMLAALPAGARIRIRCGGRAQPGDTVAYVSDQQLLIAHRMLSRVRRGGRVYLMLRGDANWFCDAPIDETRVLGVVTAFQDGSVWRPVPPSGGDRFVARVITRLSYWSIVAGLTFGERCAFKVSQGMAVAARWFGRLLPGPRAPLAT
jgi:hypothetical protein